jgi:benzylsuccinate CoA-transferase BbsF subunit
MSDEEWNGLGAAMDNAAWTQAPDLASHDGRLQKIKTLHEQLAKWTRTFDDRALAERLQSHGVAAAPVLNVADLLNDPHYRVRGTFIEVQHPLGFPETIYGAYVKTSRTEADVRTGPTMGQDNDYVFKQLLGLAEEKYDQLVEDQVIY